MRPDKLIVWTYLKYGDQVFVNCGGCGSKLGRLSEGSGVMEGECCGRYEVRYRFPESEEEDMAALYYKREEVKITKINLMLKMPKKSIWERIRFW